MLQVLLRQAASIAASTNLCFDARHTATAGFAGFSDVVWPVAGTFRNLVTELDTAPGVGATRTFTLVVNSVASSLTTTHGSADTQARDATHDVAVAAGDIVRITCTSTGSPAAASVIWTLEFESEDDNLSAYAANIATDTSGFLDIFTGLTNVTASVVEQYIPCNGVITGLAGANTFTGVTVGNELNVFLYLNGVKQDGTGGTVDTRLSITDVLQFEAVFAAFNLPVARGDAVYLGIEEVGTYPSSWTTIGMSFFAATAGESIIASHAGSTPSSAVAHFHLLHSIGEGLASWTTSNAFGQHLRCGVSSVSLRDLLLTASDDPGAGNTRTFEVMVNGSVPVDTPQGVVSEGVLIIDDTRSAFFTDGQTVGPMRHTPASTPIVSGTERWSMVMAAEEPPPPGGGETPPGTNPAAGSLPSDTPQIFCVVSDLADGTILDTVAEAIGGPFNDAADYYGGYKEARVEGLDPLTRKSTTPTGGVQASTTRFVLNDADGHYRALWGVTRLRNRKWDTYLIDHADRVNEVPDAAYRIGSGIVRSHGPLEGFGYEIGVEGMLSRHLSQKRREKLVPQNRLDTTKFPVLAERYQDGWSPPIGYGELSDEDFPTPQGVVRGTYVATANLQDVFGGGAPSVVVDYYVFFGHAVQSCENLYITVPAWTPDTAYLVGDVIRPSAGGNGWLYRCEVAGTSDSSAPTFPTTVGTTVVDNTVTWRNIGADDTSRRYVIPTTAYGQIIAEPHKPGWATVTGSSALYIDYNGFRYTGAVVLHSHRFAKSLREGSMVLSGNFRGIEDVGDGTGALIESAPRILQHFWSNFVERSYTTGAWGGVPAFGGYSLIDTTTIEAVHTFLNSIGAAHQAILFGHQGQQETAFHCLQQILTSGDFDVAENRHGQIIATVEDPAAAAVVTFTDQHDAVSFRPYHDSQGYANVVRYRFGYRYVPNIAQVLVDGAGQPLPARNTPEHSEWVSGLRTFPAEPASSAAVIANDGEEVYLDVDFYGVRDGGVAGAITERLLARALGPEGDGPLHVEITTGLQGLTHAGGDLDIGTVFAVTHVEGLGSGGYTAAVHQVRAVTFEPGALRVRLEGRLLTG